MVKKKRQSWIDEDCFQTINQMFPYEKSMYIKTKKLNQMLRNFLEGRAIKGKKGSVQDIFYIIGGFFVVAIFVLFIFKLISASNDQFQTIDTLTDDAKAASTKMTNIYSGSIDGMMMVLFFGLMVITLILGAMVSVHPVFIIFYIIVLVIGVMFGGMISNAYGLMAEQAIMADVAGKLFWMGLIFRFLPFLIGVFGLILAAVMYKAREGL